MGCVLNPVLTDLAIQVGLVLVGALIRSHAPKVWPYVAKIFGGTATTPAAAPPPIVLQLPSQAVNAAMPPVPQAGFPRLHQPEDHPQG